MTDEPRARSAALAGPAFTTRATSLALHAANRHVERWAPTSANHSAPLRTLGFVDRLVSPWLDTAQRSAGLRMFTQYIGAPLAEREPAAVSWVFPRPWYQDELDWMAAARAGGGGEAMLTTRGTYASSSSPMAAARVRELVAPALSVTRPIQPFAPLAQGALAAQMQPQRPELHAAVSRWAALAPELVTPPSPRGVDELSDQRARVADLARVTQLVQAGASEEQYRAIVERAQQRLAADAAREDQARRVAVEVRRASEGRAHEEVRQRAVEDARRAGEAARVEATRAAVVRAEAAREAAARVEAAGDVTTRAEAAREVAARADAARTDAAREVAARADAARTDAARDVAARVEVARTDAAREAAARADAARNDAVREVAAREDAVRADAARGDAARVDAARAEAAARVDVARADAARDLAARVETARVDADAGHTGAPQAGHAARVNDVRRIADALVAMGAAPTEARTIAASSESLATAEARVEARRTGRLHEQSRRDAARDAGRAPTVTTAPTPPAAPVAPSRAPDPAALAALDATLSAIAPELAALIAARPDRAIATITEIHDALHAAELFARGGYTADPATGPRLVLPAGLGGLAAMTLPEASGRTYGAPRSALAAATATAPSSLGHVAWADRWLARFAGARTASLDAFAFVTGATDAATSELRLFALAEAAPASVFVAPDTAPPATPITTAPPIVRYDDAAETPDDVFAAISAAASRSRKSPARPASPASDRRPASATAAPIPAEPYTDRLTIADQIAGSTPLAPGAGMSAQLASSPFAPALRHVLPMPSAPSFDVRALFGEQLASAYLAGILEPATLELVKRFDRAPTAIGAFATPGASPIELRTAPFDAAYVAPIEPGVDAMPDARAGADTAPSRGEARPGTRVEDTRGADAPARELEATLRTLTTLRSTLLAPTRAPDVSPARALLDAMAAPLLGAPAQAGWGAPGIVGDRAQTWSVEQERSSADLAFDFVTPELVLAARVYGLGPVEAAQAARLAISGPGQLATMATAIDRTFVQAMALDATGRAITAYPTRSAVPPVATATDVSRATPAASASPASIQDAIRDLVATGESGGDVRAALERLDPVTRDAIAAAPNAEFGVSRRAPLCAFLWPAATVGALGMTAAAPDGEQSMSVAALELLAAHTVAELGTYATLAPLTDGTSPTATMTTSPATAATTAPARTGVAFAPDALPEPAVLASAHALVSTEQRARFDALYVALGASPAGKTWSPAARAARALALAGRGDDAPTSARERAAIAWEVLPVVHATADLDEPGSLVTSTSGRVRAQQAHAQAQAQAQMQTFATPDMRPGLAALSARAGEALGAYVAAPSSPPPTSVGQSSAPLAPAAPSGPASRAPTAAPELVRTGRPAGRHGGGEVEIPSWFEAAARKMLDDRGSAADGISLAELTLVSAAPSASVAASSVSASAVSSAPAPVGGAAGGHGGQAGPDIEQLAHEVYQQIIAMMEVARERNGEPYL